MIRKAFPIILTMILGLWAGDVITHAITASIAAGATPDETINAVTAALAHPTGIGLDRDSLLGGIAGMFLVGVAWLYKWSMRRNYRDGEEFGSARWARPEEMAPYTDRDRRQNLQMTASEGLSLDTMATRRNLNTIVIGGSGSGKTSGYVLPNIANASMDYVCTDPKGELHDRCARRLADAGYEIHKLDLIDLTTSTTFNPLKYIDPDKADVAIMRLVGNIIDNTNNPEARNGGDQFWEKSEKSLLTALIGYIYYTADDKHRNLAGVLDLTDDLEASEEDETRMSEMDIKIQAARELVREWEASPDDWDEETGRTARGLKFVVSQYTPFSKGAGETKKSIIISIGVRLAPLQVVNVRKILETDNIGIDHIGETGRRTAIFLALPDEDRTFNFIAAIFYQCLFDNVIKRTRGMDGQALPTPLHCFLDEFANVGRIPNFDTLVSTIRSRNISVSVILQTMAQLKAMYEKQWETIIGNCDSILFLGGNEQTTTEWISKQLGKATIDMRDTSQSKGASGSFTISNRRTGRELMTPDELAQMDNAKCVYMLRGVHPFLSDKIRPGATPRAAGRSTLKHSKGWRPRRPLPRKTDGKDKHGKASE